MEVEIPLSVQSLFRAFDNQGLKWALLRPVTSAFSAQSDIDLLITPMDVPSAADILKEAGFLRAPIPDYGTHRHFVRYDADDDRWTWLDVVTELRFGEYGCIRVPVEQHCLTHRQINGTVAQLAAADLFWVLLLRCLLEKGHFPDRDVARLQECVAYVQPEDEFARAAEAMFSWCHVSELLQIVVRGDWTALELLSASILKRMYRPWSRYGLRVLAHRLDTFRKLISRFRRRGVGVALCTGDADPGSLIALIELSAEPPLRVLCRRHGVLTVVIDQLAFNSTFSLISACARTLFHKVLGRLVIWHVPLGASAKSEAWLRMAAVDCTFQFTPDGRRKSDFRDVCFDSPASEAVCRRIIVENIWKVYTSRWALATQG